MSYRMGRFARATVLPLLLAGCGKQYRPAALEEDLRPGERVVVEGYPSGCSGMWFYLSASPKAKVCNFIVFADRGAYPEPSEGHYRAWRAVWNEVEKPEPGRMRVEGVASGTTGISAERITVGGREFVVGE